MEENKTFEINEETVVLEPEEVEYYNDDVLATEAVINEELNEEMTSKTSNMLLLGAVFAASAAATHVGIKIFKKVKTNKINKELGRIREELIEQFTKDGSIKDYTEDTLDEMSKYIYFKKHNNL